jgi:hypothetical protein
MLSEVFLSSVLTTASGLVLACLGVAYKSKCKHVNLCCGLIVLKRSISAELIEDTHLQGPCASTAINQVQDSYTHTELRAIENGNTDRVSV